MVDPGSEEARKAWFAALDRTQEAVTPAVQLTKNSSKVQYAAEKFWTLEAFLGEQFSIPLPHDV